MTGSAWSYIRYFGTVKCPRCERKGYASKGRIMSSVVLMIRHQIKRKGKLRNQGTCYGSIDEIREMRVLLN